MVTKVMNTITYVTASNVYQFIDLISALNLKKDSPSSASSDTLHTDYHYLFSDDARFVTDPSNLYVFKSCISHKCIW